MRDGARLDAVSAMDLLAVLPDPTLIVGSDGGIVAANRRADVLFGYSGREWSGIALQDLVPLRYRRWHADLHRQFAARPVARAMGGGAAIAARRKSGSEFPAEINLAALRRNGDRVFILSIRDLTRRNTEEATRERDRLRFLERVITAQDDERRRIARELHDEAGQALTSLMVRLRALEDAPTLGAARARASRLRGSLSDAIGGLARLARGLHPSLLDDLGLAPALRRQAGETAEAIGVPVTVHVRGLGARRLPLPVETALYRIAQEALTNVARHSRARRVDVTLLRNAAGAHLVVADDGRGFAPPAHERPSRRRHSLGLLGIRERAAALGGAAHVASAPGRGTTVTVTVPLRAPRGTTRRAVAARRVRR